ncbi:MAG: efflux RND transporter periplasmic adaptor subunit [Pirellulaceae bacterium]
MALCFCVAQSAAQTAKYDDSYSLQGFSQPFRVSQVASTASGTVESLCVREGELVISGQCLLKIDHSIHDAKLELARVGKDSLGETQSAKAELDANLTRLQRMRELASRQHASQVELLQAEESVAVSRASLQRATDHQAQQAAEYERLLAESKAYCINAPFDGVVVEFAKQKGEYIGPGEWTVCTVADLNTLLVEFLVPGSYRHNLSVDSQAEVYFTVANRSVSGTIQYISPYPNGETNTYTVKVRVENANGELNAGERCRLDGINQQSPSLIETADTKITMRD